MSEGAEEPPTPSFILTVVADVFEDGTKNTSRGCGCFFRILAHGFGVVVDVGDHRGGAAAGVPTTVVATDSIAL